MMKCDGCDNVIDENKRDESRSRLLFEADDDALDSEPYVRKEADLCELCRDGMAPVLQEAWNAALYELQTKAAEVRGAAVPAKGP